MAHCGAPFPDRRVAGARGHRPAPRPRERRPDTPDPLHGRRGGDDGAAFGEFASPGGAFARRPIAEVQDSFGARGDGVADDTAAIQAGLDSLRNMATNNWSVLYFPAGTYRITQQLTTVRTTHHDFLGSEIIGENPETTSIVWAGAAGGTMFRWSAWYDKVSRLTFDGKGLASNGIVRAGAFSTYSEMSDLIFKDIRAFA